MAYRARALRPLHGAIVPGIRSPRDPTLVDQFSEIDPGDAPIGSAFHRNDQLSSMRFSTLKSSKSGRLRARGRSASGEIEAAFAQLRCARQCLTALSVTYG